MVSRLVGFVVFYSVSHVYKAKTTVYPYNSLQVLMQTIEREPPSLKSYPDDRQPGGDVFSRNFKEVKSSRVDSVKSNVQLLSWIVIAPESTVSHGPK